MSEKKQIVEEMARIMEHDGCSSHDCEKCYGGKFGADCTFFEDSRALYDAGYRKQIEAEWLSAYDYGVKCGVKSEEDLAVLKLDDMWKFCSNCDQQIRWKRNFCPNCGAKMKGGAE